MVTHYRKKTNKDSQMREGDGMRVYMELRVWPRCHRWLWCGVTNGGLIPTFGALDPRAMSFNKKMGEKINKITRELDAIAKRRLDLHLREGVGGVSFGIEERLPTTSLVDESRIHGRDADKEKIIELMLSDEATQLGQLAEEQCWLLFAQTALTNLDSNECQNLESTGRKIAKKCKGLPLVAKTLGGLLHSNQDITAWNEVLNNEIWDLSNEQSSILPALNLSYHYLPTTLKRCFAYCSIFPKDYVFEREKLVLLWMAEGFLDGSKRGETIEQFGRKCFNSLLLRSFFQQYDNNDSQFVMHDLIHDLAQFTSGKFCFRLEVEQQNQISKEIRHSSHYDIKELPHSIENLKHLRYLDLSHTRIRTLPESITTLFNLQTLMLSESVVHLPSITELEVSNICSIQVELPTILLKLTSLRKLVIKECQSLSSLPEMGLPPMLETLRIENDCVKLKSFPKQGLPASLSILEIHRCPVLKKRCQRDKGKEWRKIAHIPRIKMDGEVMD
ncbi:unnamed protein product, partial [Vitis vinifera]